MTATPVVVAERVGKRYDLGTTQQYRALRDEFSDLFARRRRSPPETLWALKDVEFTVDQGEVVGLIGRNGAGKSTMLKILSRITAPTEGEVRMRGQVGSLLEVGTGFHPELTGRENIFLSGAILGMPRREILRQFDEIVEFAEVERFVSTPVKHYSVGMYMRLAFSVAAHLNAEILMVDEVLAVGDLRFQEKCLGKISAVARSGRTVLLVSHNLAATAALCDRCLLFESGRLIGTGEPSEVIGQYLRLDGMSTKPGEPLDLRNLARTGTGRARFVRAVIVAGGDGVRSGAPFALDVDIATEGAVEVQSLGLTVSSEAGQMLVNLDSALGQDRLRLGAGTTRFRLQIDALHLTAGRYRVGLRLADPVTTRIGSGALDMLEPAFTFELGAGDVDVAPGSLVPATFAVEHLA